MATIAALIAGFFTILAAAEWGDACNDAVFIPSWERKERARSKRPLVLKLGALTAVFAGLALLGF